jgi:hypothetical protein
MDHMSLCSITVSRDSQIRMLREQLRKETAKSVRLGISRDRALDAIPIEDATDLNRPFFVERKGKKGGHFALRGQFAMGIRRNLGNIAASDLGSAMLEDSQFETHRHLLATFPSVFPAPHPLPPTFNILCLLGMIPSSCSLWAGVIDTGCHRK